LLQAQKGHREETHCEQKTFCNLTIWRKLSKILKGKILIIVKSSERSSKRKTINMHEFW